MTKWWLILAVVVCGCSGMATDEDAGALDSGAGGGAAGGGTGGGAGGGTAEDAGLDAGALDAGRPDASTACPYVYCEDFEAYDAGGIANNAALGPWKASVGGDAGVMFVDGWKAKGHQALHVWVPAGSAAHGTLNQKAPAGLVPGNDLFGRASVYYSNQGDAGLALNVHSWLFNAAGHTTDGGTASMNLGGGGAKLQLNYHPPLPLNEQAVQGGVMTAGAWHCVQWEYDGSGTPPRNQAKVWVDSTLVLSVDAGKGWDFAAPWNTFDFGFTHYQELGNPVEIALDDFALDGQPIPCP